MIIRAVSDSESDDELHASSSAPRHSVFDPPATSDSSVSGSAARVAWFAACGALVLLLLVDLAAVLGSSNPSVDTFALLPVLVTTVLYRETIILPPTATLLNQLVGFALVSAWIYSREKSLAAGHTSQWLRSARYGPWTIVVLLCLGHAVSCLYLLFALLESNGDRAKFWLGRKHSGAKTAPYGRA
ncbi:hypothetical protein PHYSODRAFT_317816 [Phytophthora sojae]|uniref:Uncharacterized protein n=1 Tax=Phytophthora sojae (strain P6497) TaxID=1094619 RepID=G5A1A8_PHYSP|nr:hypothetical protein PHYSODRAFT_317816 [Phytophthora sojae]EGZ10707.1 hypothetical protein PHYSODRAFT_317816 [Phytophthora sojae]|eukprot:XP_009533452.1 hypothetical protein PHYSODRAFT_317816 [Phytophthora sojae]